MKKANQIKARTKLLSGIKKELEDMESKPLKTWFDVARRKEHLRRLWSFFKDVIDIEQ